MMIRFIILFAGATLLAACARPLAAPHPEKGYRSELLTIQPLTPHTYQHISWLQTESFGRVPCNGMVVADSGEAVVFDTPVDNASSEELIAWVENTLKCRIKAIIPGHFHDDCVGGLLVFHQKNIPSYANKATVALIDEKEKTPVHEFSDSIQIAVGHYMVSAAFFGEGHTRDNVVGYFPAEQVMFGGCLIKEMNAGKGYLGDANEAAWSDTVRKVRAAYPGVKVVVPGHGDSGGRELLDFTIQLFDRK